MTANGKTLLPLGDSSTEILIRKDFIKDLLITMGEKTAGAGAVKCLRDDSLTLSIARESFDTEEKIIYSTPEGDENLFCIDVNGMLARHDAESYKDEAFLQDLATSLSNHVNVLKYVLQSDYGQVDDRDNRLVLLNYGEKPADCASFSATDLCDEITLPTPESDDQVSYLVDKDVRVLAIEAIPYLLPKYQVEVAQMLADTPANFQEKIKEQALDVVAGASDLIDNPAEARLAEIMFELNASVPQRQGLG